MPPRGRPAARRNQTKKPKKIPLKNGFDDEQTHLALALSISEAVADNQDTSTAKALRSADIDVQQKVTNAFSILMTPKPAEKKRRKKLDTQLVSALSRTTEQQRLHNLGKKVSHLLIENDDLLSNKTIDTQAFQESMISKDKVCRLWIADTWDCKPGESDHFYVKMLLPYIERSRVAAGSKIKKMVHIPGWKPLTNNDATFIQPAPEGTHATINQTAGNTTALILAQLAEDETLNQTQLSETIKNSHDTTGFLSQGHTRSRTDDLQTQEREKLANDMNGLVGDPASSDLAILCRGSEIVHAHSLFLKTRCPLLYDARINHKIDLTFVSKDAVMALLRFIYSSSLDVPPSVAKELKYLATKFELTVLGGVCNALISKDSSEPTDIHTMMDKTLQELLDEVWSSDAESESDIDGVKSHSGSDEEMDDLYKLATPSKHHKSILHADISEQSSDSDENSSFSKFNEDNMYSKSTFGAALLCKLEESFMMPEVMDVS